jgi:DNA primase
MTGRIADEKVEQIRARADIVEVVSGYLSLKRSGRNHVGLCPFHAEKTPSFNVNAERQIYHCFGCGAGGDVFAFLMNMEGLSFPEAVRRLGERYGIEVEEEIVTPEQEQRRQERDRLLRVMEVACDFYQRLLLEDPAGRPARAYLRGRGFDGELARQYRLGWAPASWEALAQHLHAKGFDPQWARDRLGLIRAGREGRGDYDLFRRRLLFPILDERGRPVAFGGRILDGDGPKYINSPESPIYHKGRVLYGLYQARDAMRRADAAIVVEGYFDQLAMCRAGFGNAVATCGTALTPEHVRLLRRFASRVLLLFDQDAAGCQATFRAMDVLLPEGLQTSVVTLEPGEDPDSFLRGRDADRMRERIEAARPVMEVFVEQTLAEHGEDIGQRARAVEKILAKVQLLPGAIERNLYVQDIAVRTGLDEQLLRSRLQPPRQRDEGSASVSAAVAAPRPPARLAPAARARREGAEFKAQRLLLGLMFNFAAARREALRLGPENMFSDADFHFIAARMLERPATDGPLDEKILQEHLSEVQNGLLSGILLEDEALFAENPDTQFAQCCRTVNKERIKRQLNKLQEQMREAEKVRNFTLLAELQRQETELQKMRKG